MSPAALLIRADASQRIGTGHVMRCLALAQQWGKRGAKVCFASVDITPAAEERLSKEGFETCRLSAEAGSLEDAAQTIACAKSHQASWIIGDGYALGGAWQQGIKAAGLLLLVLDDYGHADHYHADLVLNQNLSADSALYAQREAGTRLLLGSRYTLLRNEFLSWHNWSRTINQQAGRILVTLGGSDPDNVSSKILESLAPLENIEATILVGGSNPHVEQLRQQAAAIGPKVKVLCNATQMPELMAWADIAISAAGSTSWELAYLGLPSLLVICADNQRLVAEKLDEKDISLNLGWHQSLSSQGLTEQIRKLLADPQRRLAMSERARRLVDHLGSSRVLCEMQAHELSLRKASTEDARLLWHWANESAVRKSAFNQAPISWESHVAWFGAKLSNPKCAIYLASDTGNKNLGQIRFEWEDADKAVVDLSLDATQRGRGLGAALICKGVQVLFATQPVRTVEAFVKEENGASLAAFECAGFKRIASLTMHGVPTVKLSASRDHE